MKKVKIDGVEYIMKYSIRALFVYEQITGYPYSGSKLIDLYTLMYAMLMSGNPNFDLGFDAFIDICDIRPDIYEVFKSVLEEETKRRAAFIPVAVDDKKKE